jgi:hypothetical protein
MTAKTGDAGPLHSIWRRQIPPIRVGRPPAESGAAEIDRAERASAKQSAATFDAGSSGSAHVIDGDASTPLPSSSTTKARGARSFELRLPPMPFADVGRSLADQFRALLGIDAKHSEPATTTTEALGERAQVLEDRAFEVLEILTPKRVGEAEQAFDAWFAGVEARQSSGQPIAAMEHLTLLHVLKSKLFDGQPALRAYVPRMESVLCASDLALTKKTRGLDDILATRLPKHALAQQSSDAQKIHAAIFATRDGSFVSAIKDLVADYVPTAKDGVVAVGLLAALFTHGGAALLGGAVHGYLIATLLEHTIHARIGHASQRTLDKLHGVLARFGPIGEAIHKEIEKTRVGHAVVHHGSYGGNYVDRFAPANADSLPADLVAQKRTQKRELLERQMHELGDDATADMNASDYGRKLAHALRAALVVAPAATLVSMFSAGIANLAGVELGPLFVAASALTSLIFVPASNSLHPYLHMTRDEAMAKAGPVMKLFLESRYVSHIAQHHYLHHKEAGVNHNLVAGADFALGYEPTRVDAIVALRKLHTFY